MPDKIVNHFVLADGSTARYDYGGLANTPDFDATQNVDMADLLYNVEWEQGSINADTGEDKNSISRIRTGYIDVRNVKCLSVVINPGYRFAVDIYTDIGVYAGYNTFGTYWGLHTDFSFGTESQTVIMDPRIKYVRFILSNSSDTAITPEEGNNLTVTSDYPLLNDISETYNIAAGISGFVKNEAASIEWGGRWTQAVPSATESVISYHQRRICTPYIDIPKYADSITLTAPIGYKCAYYLYDDNGSKLDQKYWSDTYTINLEEGQTKIIVAQSNTGDTEIVPSEGSVFITWNPNTAAHLQPVENIVPLSTVDLEWELGTLSVGSGVEQPSNNRIRSRFILVGKGTKLVLDSTAAGDKHLIYIFDFDKVYVNDLAWTKDNIIIENDCYIRILLNKNDQTITEDQIETIAAEEIIYRTFPQYLMDREIYTPPETIPAYFENEIDAAIATARTNIFDAGIDGDSFVFISDVHWPNNSKNSPALIKKAVDNLNLDKIICGGDLFNGGAKADSIGYLSECVNAYKDITRFYCLFGNHDSNTIGAPSTADNFTKSEVYALEQKQSDFVMNYGEPCYFYFDNPTTKTRYICLDTGLEGSSLPTAQSDWITATLNSTPDNYHILVFAHIIYMPTNDYHIGITKDEVYRTSFMNTVCTMCDTFNTNNQNKKVEAIFGGHMHFDADFATTGGIPIVLIDCDARLTFTETTPGSGTANHAAGTINEQCFDIVSIDYANSTIKCTRVGRGSDRTITY